MDWSSIITGLISGLVTLAVCHINNASIRKASEAKQDEMIAIINLKIETLTKKVEEHNNIVTRTYELEKKQSVICEQIKVANHRIDDLEKGGKNE